MRCKTQVVLAAGIGYLLGRQHKLRWGLLLAAAAASGRLSRPGGLLEHGVRALSSTPELGKLGKMGAPLVTATKDAARAAVTGRIASVSDRLRERTDSLREAAEPGGREEREEREDREERRGRAEPRAREEEHERGDGRRPTRRARRDEEDYEPEDTADVDEEDVEEQEQDEDDLVSAGARRVSRPPVRRR